MVAQTNNPDNVPLYEHFGFKVIEKRASEEIPLTCYSIARVTAKPAVENRRLTNEHKKD